MTMAGAKSVECKCEIGHFTCGYCLRNAPPPHTTSYNPDLFDLRKFADPDDREEKKNASK
jgi:hypothetical protein